MDPPDNNLIELLHENDQLKWTACNSHNIKRFSENEIEKITSKYRTMVGQGAFGKVYAGTLEDKSMVAVKKLDHNDSKMKQCLAKEIIVHSQINHRHVTRLIGYCLEENALMMVTEYIPNGNLNDILHRDVRPISLDTRLRIAMECAQALGYMHSQMYTPVIHGDIKPANILLDHNLSAKISDFGISRLVNTDNTLYTMHVMGSIGYMDPLFVRTGHLTPKSDVYSFGVVLLEIRVREMFDAEISDLGNTKILKGIAKLIGECLGMEIHKRPEMTNVAERLQELRRAHHQGQERVGLFSWGRKNKLDFSAKRMKGLLESRGQVIGQGLLGKMYKVTLDSGTVLAMKRMKGLGGWSNCLPFATTEREGIMALKLIENVDLLEAEFDRHIATIKGIKSELLVPLHWHHFGNSGEKIIMYSYMPMGSLSALLHGNGVIGKFKLDWEQRTTIALTVAHGLAAIHSAGPRACHGNIKSSNVLLTNDYEARLSEHGLYTLVNMPSFVAATRVSGYHAPEVTADTRVTKEADVYSIGILLIELLTAREPADAALRGGNFSRWVHSIAREDWKKKVFDAELVRQLQGAAAKGMEQFLHLAMDCCTSYDLRPTIYEVASRIEDIARGSRAPRGTFYRRAIHYPGSGKECFSL
ncbi:unnamed protein product [Urochloa decumbens]|uniref:Protein kinase domain-containing protein n=1 Tax=Urochloa decumbens TaxID=240449 RepID=A0ABC8YCK2_9POAL